MVVVVLVAVEVAGHNKICESPLSVVVVEWGVERQLEDFLRRESELVRCPKYYQYI